MALLRSNNSKFYENALNKCTYFFILEKSSTRTDYFPAHIRPTNLKMAINIYLISRFGKRSKGDNWLTLNQASREEINALADV